MEIPKHHIDIQRFAEQAELEESEIIRRIHEGVYMGRLVSGQWFVHEDALALNTKEQERVRGRKEVEETELDVVDDSEIPNNEITLTNYSSAMATSVSLLLIVSIGIAGSIVTLHPGWIFGTLIVGLVAIWRIRQLAFKLTVSDQIKVTTIMGKKRYDLDDIESLEFVDVAYLSQTILGMVKIYSSFQVKIKTVSHNYVVLTSKEEERLIKGVLRRRALPFEVNK